MKRFLASILVMVICASMLSGCAPEQTPGETTTEPTQATEFTPVGKEGLSGKKIIFFGNSYTYYGKCVLTKGQDVHKQEDRMNDEGYFYQICKANGIDVNVTNFTFGVHYLKDFHPTGCAADRGHDGLNHLSYISDYNYDYVVLQTGSGPLNYSDLLAECEPIMKPFREANPEVKFIFLANHIEYLLKDTTQYKDGYVWRSDIKKLADAGILVVDWGTLVCDIMYGKTTVPGATQEYSTSSFIISQAPDDGHHQNMLTGYITALMTYCAITGESAQGQPISFDDSRFNSEAIAAYRLKYYKFNPQTNFDAILNSEADMTGIQQLIDQYLAAKTYLNY